MQQSPYVCVCVCVCLYLLVGLLLGHRWRYEARLAGKHVTIQIQWGNMITYKRKEQVQASSWALFGGLNLIKKR